MSSLPISDGRRERKRLQTIEHLVSSAFDLFAEHGYEKVTMEQIAARADVAKGTLYKHFPVKEALVRHRFHGELAAASPALLEELRALPDCVARLRAFMHASAAFSERHREYLGPYLHYRLSEPVDTLGRDNRSGLDQIYARLLAQGQASGEITDALPAQHLADYLQFLHLGVLLRWQREPEMSLVAAFDGMLALFLDGARARRTT
ncbi:TetR/AcrR family transcriptional regulator [Azoarcus sp. KH32C]|uniref:TetR/AcrR family transcriptional regulator n=1 Tax=Azoarcus sp. KH32C TaxID=748247 RepID=UPI0002386E59|nr:TetR/AcrR family transcriptional regulator [Azoarcus sp. KH32C]BAL22831.1 transcriptional regulator, TetR family [Azoarcus sp. KH32C]